MYGRIQETGFFKEEVVNKQNWKTIYQLARMEKKTGPRETEWRFYGWQGAMTPRISAGPEVAFPTLISLIAGAHTG